MMKLEVAGPDDHRRVGRHVQATVQVDTKSFTLSAAGMRAQPTVMASRSTNFFADARTIGRNSFIFFIIQFQVIGGQPLPNL